ncbi:hypothetical protein AB0H00_21700 [Nocardia sp. NPDC023852]|uniref:hypothetical protein n=1 Tax=Nocardia sp. NPDC023852 TaxID=3154697 RepID=UPI00340810A6
MTALDPLFRSVLPSIDPSTVQAVLGRSNYTDTWEREAELFATMVMAAAARPEPEERLVHAAMTSSVPAAAAWPVIGLMVLVVGGGFADTGLIHSQGGDSRP